MAFYRQAELAQLDPTLQFKIEGMRVLSELRQYVTQMIEDREAAHLDERQAELFSSIGVKALDNTALLERP